jgi:hypothetical protein
MSVTHKWRKFHQIAAMVHRTWMTGGRHVIARKSSAHGDKLPDDYVYWFMFLLISATDAMAEVDEDDLYL